MYSQEFDVDFYIRARYEQRGFLKRLREALIIFVIVTIVMLLVGLWAPLLFVSIVGIIGGSQEQLNRLAQAAQSAAYWKSVAILNMAVWLIAFWQYNRKDFPKNDSW